MIRSITGGLVVAHIVKFLFLSSRIIRISLFVMP